MVELIQHIAPYVSLGTLIAVLRVGYNLSKLRVQHDLMWRTWMSRAEYRATLAGLIEDREP